MMRELTIGLTVLLLACGRDPVRAETPEPAAGHIQAAVTKALPLLEEGAQGAMEERPQCFTCHNQGLPILALTTARTHGFAINEEHLKKQVELTATFLDRNRANYREGKGQGWAGCHGRVCPVDPCACSPGP